MLAPPRRLPRPASVANKLVSATWRHRDLLAARWRRDTVTWLVAVGPVHHWIPARRRRRRQSVLARSGTAGPQLRPALASYSQGPLKPKSIVAKRRLGLGFGFVTVLVRRCIRTGFCSPETRFTKYLTTILRLSYDNAIVTIDLRRTCNLQNSLQWMESFSCLRFTCKIVKSSEIAFVN